MKNRKAYFLVSPTEFTSLSTFLKSHWTQLFMILPTWHHTNDFFKVSVNVKIELCAFHVLKTFLSSVSISLREHTEIKRNQAMGDGWWGSTWPREAKVSTSPAMTLLITTYALRQVSSFLNYPSSQLLSDISDSSLKFTLDSSLQKKWATGSAVKAMPFMQLPVFLTSCGFPGLGEFCE